ncbi:MAG: hypothetical protein EBR34_15870 [Sphingomonadaceae bacterium]|nr:hypothetical protein [Sphingomonadaceae bacterium]
MSNVLESQALEIRITNLNLTIKKKDEELRRLRESHRNQISSLKAHYSKQLLELRMKKSGAKGLETIDVLYDVIVGVTGVTKEEILSQSRKRDIMISRQILCHILRESGKSLKAVAKLVRDSHHSTIMHSVEKVEDWINNPSYFKKEYRIYNLIKNNFDAIEL